MLLNLTDSYLIARYCVIYYFLLDCYKYDTEPIYSALKETGYPVLKQHGSMLKYKIESLQERITNDRYNEKPESMEDLNID